MFVWIVGWFIKHLMVRKMKEISGFKELYELIGEIPCTVKIVQTESDMFYLYINNKYLIIKCDDGAY